MSPAPSCVPLIEWMRVTSTASVGAQKRKQRGQPAREHRLPGAGRALHEQVVRTGGRDLQCAARARVPAHVAQVRARRDRVGVVGKRRGQRERSFRGQHVGDLGQRLGTGDRQPVHERGLTRVLARDDQAGEARPPSALRHRERPAHAAHLPAERELPEHRDAFERRGGDLPARREQRDREREVEPGPDLAQVCRAPGSP